jgi:hypothetical protein
MRARNIKPGFFENEDLGEMSFAGRLLFAGLWCLADREGRLCDRPKRIKGDLFRFDGDVPVDGLLDELQRRGFIQRYAVDGQRYIQVINFRKHQSPHHTEKMSIIPEVPPDFNGEPAGEPPLENGEYRPDSLIHRFTDSPNPDSNRLPPPPPPSATAPGVVAGKPATGEAPEALKLQRAMVKPCPHNKIVALYHQVLPRLPAVKVWNEFRKRLLQGRWREDPERQNLDWWRTYFEKVNQCPWLLGDGPENGWRANLEWLIRPDNFLKVLNGWYERSAKRGGSGKRFLTHEPGKFDAITICLDSNDDESP